MDPPPQPFASDECNPTSCIGEANGSSATIGYQTIDGRFGSNLHVGPRYGGLTSEEEEEEEEGGVVGENADSTLVFPGGLSNRSFRYNPVMSGTSRVLVGRSETREVCAFAGDFAECKPFGIEAAANAGELMITELMIDSTAGVGGQWLEVRNLSGRTIDLQGFELRSNQGSHRIAAPLPLGSGDSTVLAASSGLPFTPAYVYGEDVPLNRLIDRLELHAGGALIHAVSWGVGWDIRRDRVLSLDPIFHGSAQESSNFAEWCDAGPTGSPGELGAGCTNPWYDVDLRSSRPFIDIHGSGAHAYDAESDDSFARIAAPSFPIEVFGQRFGKVWVGSKGWVSLHDTEPTRLPHLGPPFRIPRSESDARSIAGPLVPVFWGQLLCGDRCSVLHEQRTIDAEEVFIVQWEDFHLRLEGGDGSPGSVTFQLQIWEDGDLVFAYRVDNPFRRGSPEWVSYEGDGSWIGLEGTHPSDFVSAHPSALNTDQRPIGLDGRSIHFRSK